MPGPYSAGSVFLEVVPVFRDVQNDIQRQAEDIGTALGKEMGERAERELGKSVPRAVDKALSNPAVGKAAKDAGKKVADEYDGAFRAALGNSTKRAMDDLGKKVDVGVADARQRLKALNDLSFKPELDSRAVLDDLARLMFDLKMASENMDLELEVRANADTALKSLNPLFNKLQDLSIDIDLDTDKAERKLGAYLTRMQATVREAVNDLPEIEITADSSQVDREMMRLRERLIELDEQIELGIDADEARREFARLRADFAVFAAREDVKVKVSYDFETAGDRMEEFLAEDRKIDVDIEADYQKISLLERHLGGLARRLNRTGRDTDASAQSFRGFNGVLLAAVSIGPLLIPVLIALAGGAVALGTSLAFAATALLPLALGLAGIGTAVGALADVEREAAQDQAAYARTLRSASNGVRDAQLAVDRARESAAESAEQSARRIQDAMRGEEEAQRDLIRAQRDAERAQERLMRARQDAQDQLEDMALRLRGGALAERQAVIDLFEAQVAYRNALADPGATVLEREQAAIQYERQSLALEQIRLENGRMAQEQAEAARLGVEGSQEVVSAQEGVVSANEQVVDAQQRVADAAQATRDAQEAAARDQRDSLRAIEDSQRRLQDAQLTYQDALFRTGELGSAAAQKLDEAFAKLSPAGQAFALWIFSLRDELQMLRNVAQEGLLPGLQGGLQALIDQYGPGFTTFVGEISSLLGDLARRAGTALANPVWQEFFETVAKYAPIFMTQWAQIGGSIATALAQIMQIAAPFTEAIGGIFVDLFQRFADWVASPEGSAMITAFLEHVAEIMPDVLRFFGALVGAFVTLVEAISPYADALLMVFTGFLNFIAGLDPRLLGVIIAGIFILIAAFQSVLSILAGATLVATTAFSLIVGAAGSTAALVVGAIVLIVGAFALMYANFEWFRDLVGVVGAAIAATWAALVEGVAWYIDNVLLPWWRILGAIFSWVWENVLKPLFTTFWESFKYAADTISWIINDVLGPVFELLGAIVRWLWDEYIGPFIDDLVAGWNEHIQPVFDLIGSWLGDNVVPPFKTAMETLGDLWHGLMDLAATPVRFIVEEIINRGLIDNFNKLAKAFNTSEISHMELPPGFDNPPARRRFATGGQVGGYSPGPTADNIPAWLTAGEFVQPVRAVQTYGADLFEAFRRGLIDPRVARQLLGGYASGGLVNFGRLLQSMGFRVGEHPAFGGVTSGAHMRNSLHYSGRAIDVNWAPGTSLAEQRKIDEIIPLALDYGLGAIWRVKNHFGHAHFEDSKYRAIGTGGGAAGVLGTIVGAAKALFDDPLGALRAGVLQAAAPLAAYPFGAMLLGGAGKLVDAAVNFVTGNAPGEVASDPGKTRLYDSGGIVPPGLSGVLNLTGGNEHLGILTNEQWANLQKVASNEGTGTHIDLTLQSGTPSEAIEAVLFALRHARRGGVYERRG